MNSVLLNICSFQLISHSRRNKKMVWEQNKNQKQKMKIFKRKKRRKSTKRWRRILIFRRSSFEYLKMKKINIFFFIFTSMQLHTKLAWCVCVCISFIDVEKFCCFATHATLWNVPSLLMPWNRWNKTKKTTNTKLMCGLWFWTQHITTSCETHTYTHTHT